MNQPQYVSYHSFFSNSHLLCVFSTRQGGISKGNFSSLNLGLNTPDVTARVIKNRELLFSSLNITYEQLAFTDQIHSTNIEHATKAGIFKQCDALVTDKNNLFLAIQTADCFPVFVYDPAKQVIAAIHAGWRGAVNGIVQKTIAHLMNKFHSNVHDLMVVIGPGMQQECFEIKDDVAGLFPDRYLSTAKSAEHLLLDLQAFIIDVCLDLSIKNKHIAASSECTKCLPDKYYSYRRDKDKSGRMMGIIGIRGSVCLYS